MILVRKVCVRKMFFKDYKLLTLISYEAVITLHVYNTNQLIKYVKNMYLQTPKHV